MSCFMKSPDGCQIWPSLVSKRVLKAEVCSYLKSARFTRGRSAVAYKRGRIRVLVVRRCTSSKGSTSCDLPACCTAGVLLLGEVPGQDTRGLEKAVQRVIRHIQHWCQELNGAW